MFLLIIGHTFIFNITIAQIINTEIIAHKLDSGNSERIIRLIMFIDCYFSDHIVMRSKYTKIRNQNSKRFDN